MFEATGLDGLQTHLTHDVLLDIFSMADLRHLGDVPMACSCNRSNDEASLSGITRELDRLVETIMLGVPGDGVRDLTAALDVEQLALKVNLAGQSVHFVPLLQPIPLPRLAMGEVYRASVAHLRETLMTRLGRYELVEQDRALTDRIVLHPAKGVPTGFVLDIEGDLTVTLSLTRDSKKVVTLSDDDLLQMKLVAGTGFEPVTFRL